MRRAFALLALSVLSTTSIAARQSPDFSGRWVLDEPTPSAPTAATELIVRQESRGTTRDGMPMVPPLVALEVERRSGAISRSDRYIVGTAGGSVSGSSLNDAIGSTIHSTTWIGDSIAIDWASYSGPSASRVLVESRREVWSLVGPDTLVIEVTERTKEAFSQTASLTYRRQNRSKSSPLR